MHPALAQREHRPWPIPERRWVGRQSWCDLAFLHWPVKVSDVRHLVPPALEIQEFEGRSWIGLVPFRMEGVGLRGWPDIPGTSAFPELNLRLYVTLGGKPGVWFLSLDADNALAVWAARRFLHLPYHRAAMLLEPSRDGIVYGSVRRHTEARFFARYRPTSEPRLAEPGSLEHWLTERYCLYAATPNGSIRRIDVHHVQWPLQSAEVEVRMNTMLEPHGVAATGAPLCHFARRVDVVVWAPESVG